jgi:hypothetical protein
VAEEFDPDVIFFFRAAVEGLALAYLLDQDRAANENPRGWLGLTLLSKKPHLRRARAISFS